uniref:Uncharacterized protein n=1 Tax=Timema tahoe TaxID=61484 RepID=A0A7R9FGA7_9NEOP|nr:unnamed protein product [Timema tahoe]
MDSSISLPPKQLRIAWDPLTLDLIALKRLTRKFIENFILLMWRDHIWPELVQIWGKSDIPRSGQFQFWNFSTWVLGDGVPHPRHMGLQSTPIRKTHMGALVTILLPKPSKAVISIQETSATLASRRRADDGRRLPNPAGRSYTRLRVRMRDSKRREWEIVASGLQLFDVIVLKEPNVVGEHRRSAEEGSEELLKSANEIAKALNLDLRLPRTASRQQYRANHPSSSLSEYFRRSLYVPYLDSLSSSLEGSKSPTPVAPPRTRRTGGWADETTKSGKRRSAMNVMDQERFQTQDDKRDDSDDDIPVIPDLDDLQDDQLDSQVAVAPSVAVNRVATYKELDSDLLKHSAFATLDDINLQLLTKRLNLEADVKEPDEVWTWDLLFTEVSSELRKEWEAKSEISPDKDNAAKQSESHN